MQDDNRQFHPLGSDTDNDQDAVKGIPDENELIIDSNTGNNSTESRLIQEEMSSKIFGGAQFSTGVIGGNNEGFVDDMPDDQGEDLVDTKNPGEQ